jgi:hypothetical protein
MTDQKKTHRPDKPTSAPNVPAPIPVPSLAVVPTDITSMALPVAEVVERTRMVVEILEKVMIQDVHYGIVPGTQKPSLWQPGAEKLALTFQLAPDLHIDDLSQPPSPSSPNGEIRYRVIASVRHVPTDNIVGIGVGEASSREEKNAWREAICEEEWEATPETHRRIKYKKKWGGRPRKVVGVETVQQIRTEPADIANTVLKMATKRARVDGMKSTCAASDVFAQDLEDLEALGVDLSGGEAPQPIDEPRAKKEKEEEKKPAAADRPGGDTTIDQLHEARSLWHSKGTISEPQQNRLYAIARGAGWGPGQVDDLIGKELSCATDEIAFGDPYDAVVGWFQSNNPEAK